MFLISVSTLACTSVSVFVPACSGQTAGAVTVRVSEAQNEAPIDQAEVKLLSFGHMSASYWAFTDGGGHVDFQAVERGVYQIDVKRPGFEPGHEEVDVAAGIHYNVQVHMKRLESEKASAVAPTGAVSVREAAVPPEARREFELGLASLQSDADASIGHFRKAVGKYPKFAQAWTYLALAYLKTNRHQDAVDSLSKALRADPGYALAYALRGRLALDEGNIQEAQGFLEDSVRLEPGLWDGHFELARCYYNLEKTEAALEQAKLALAVPDASPMTHLLLADIYTKMKRSAEAVSELEAFAAASPQSPIIPRVKDRISRLKKNQ